MKRCIFDFNLDNDSQHWSNPRAARLNHYSFYACGMQSAGRGQANGFGIFMAVGGYAGDEHWL
jgi:hypothetical protein